MTVKVPVKQRDEVGKNPASSEVECYNYENCNKKGKRKKNGSWICNPSQQLPKSVNHKRKQMLFGETIMQCS